MARLRLAASDAEDLEVLSARLQDAVFKLKDASWQPKKRRFALVVNRLQWEAGGKTRVRAGLHFELTRFASSIPAERCVMIGPAVRA